MLYLQVSVFQCYKTLCRQTKHMDHWVTNESPDVSKLHLLESKNDTPKDRDFPRLVAEDWKGC